MGRKRRRIHAGPSTQSFKGEGPADVLPASLLGPQRDRLRDGHRANSRTGYLPKAGLLGDPCAVGSTGTPALLEAFDSEGWFHTGDLGSIDPNGRISYLGRTKDMLKVGGENVSPAEVEDLTNFLHAL